MAEPLFPYGYAGTPAGTGTMLTMAQVEAKTTVKKLHPEFWRRYKALMEFASTQGILLGVGTGWRIQPNPPPPGFAKPGNSNHEGFPADGKAGGAVAIDTVCAPSWPWMEKNLKAYGLRSFHQPSTNGYKGPQEDWHIQPAEIPASRMRRTEPWKLEQFPLPGGGTTPPPTPTPPPSPQPPGPPTPIEEDRMLGLVRLDTNPNALYVTDGINARLIRSDEVDELTSNLKYDTGFRYYDITTAERKQIRDINSIPKRSDDQIQLYGIEIAESKTQPG